MDVFISHVPKVNKKRIQKLKNYQAVGNAMVTYIKCKGCRSDFKSQIQMGNSKESFLRAASGSNLSNNPLQCSNCGQSFEYSGADYFWKD